MFPVDLGQTEGQFQKEDEGAGYTFCDDGPRPKDWAQGMVA
jgi:hypothetical protein